ncbi:furin-like [Ruditapes philippinarum]|uniref:furin-like n=1 Tax=Ruditapes philippinarum TaxID=129788 RepID=UPI00295BE5A2|nr:furin-like [Ruditapes philippinarum]
MNNRIQIIVFNVFIYVVILNQFLNCKCSQRYSNEWLMKAEMSIRDAEEIAIKNGFVLQNQITDDLFLLTRDDVPRSSSRKIRYKLKSVGMQRKIVFIEQQTWGNVSLRQFTVTDPLWSQMWYIDRSSSVSMTILEAWQSNFTGKGVNIAIVDNGVEHTHDDLKERYNTKYSQDVYDHDNDPSPAPGDSHGTRCAGVSMGTKNTLCNIGIAHQAQLVAIRMIGSFGVTDACKASALSNNGAHVSSNSWGGNENTFDGPSANVESALKHGTTKLRNGQGVIYVFSAGNGGYDDNCNMDGYISSIYTIGINAVSRDLKPPGYAEPCSAVLASTFSGPGSSTVDNLCSSDISGQCTTSFTGTSAAAAAASGIIALVLEANPNLSWRDMQELIVITSKSDGLLNGQFKTNGVGREVSDWFGYGLLDTQALIVAAQNWTCLQTQHKCSTGTVKVNKQIQAQINPRSVESSVNIDGCNATENCVSRVEHVVVSVTFEYSLRGAVLMYIDSPMGTRSELLTRRKEDDDKNSRHFWRMMSVQHWGEDPVGTWTLTMSLQHDPNEYGTLVEWDLIIYGTGSDCSLGEEVITDCPYTNTTSEIKDKKDTKDSFWQPWRIAIITIIPTIFVVVVIIIVIIICFVRNPRPVHP